MRLSRPLFTLVVSFVLIGYSILANHPFVSHAADNPDALAVNSTAMLDSDGTALYSAQLASGADDLEQITVSAVIPAHTTLVELVTAPPDVTSTKDGKAVTWQIAKMKKDTILGPFTFRVKADSEDLHLPASTTITVSWQKPALGSTTATPSENSLVPLAELGHITVDSKGTLNDKGEIGLVEVGDTGILISVPADAVSQPTTLTFTRMNIDDKDTPADQADTWWCALVSITAKPDVTFAKPITLILPNRNILTPGLEANVLLRSGEGDWQPVKGEGSGTSFLPHMRGNFQQAINTFSAFIGSSGTLVTVSSISMPTLSSTTTLMKAGVLKDDKTASLVSGDSLMLRKIVDGSSNTNKSPETNKSTAITFLKTVQ